MRTHLTFAAALLTALAALPQPAPCQAPAADRDGARSFAVRCGTLLLGDGTSMLRDAWLVVRDGKVVSTGKAAPPAGLRVVDASDKVVMPGIVAVDSDLSGAADSEYQVAPDALAIDAFDFERKLRDQLEGGVTTVYLSPGRARLVSGQGAVIKTSGLDIVERILTENACLRIALGDDATKAPAVFEPTEHPTSDDPLEPARMQTPTARISVLAELRALFAEAADGGVGGDGPVEHQFDEAALKAAIEGRLTVRASAFRTHDIRRALQLQKELGLRMVLEDPQQIGPMASIAAAQQTAATFRVPVRFGLANPGGENRHEERLEPDPAAPARAAAAGMQIGLAPASGVSSRDYLMAVAIAVRHGLSPERALRAIAADAAAILGVADRVGSLAPGKDADFVVLSGEPLAVGTMVESTWIDGKRVYTREISPVNSMLAVRCARILDATGRVYRPGVILAQNGRIKAIGENLAIPNGAKVIDIEGGVMTPGFIDAFSHLGLAGEGTGVPNGTPADRIHAVVQHDDPMFGPALGAGLTTLLVGGKDTGGAIASRFAALKTGAQCQDSMVVSEIAGLRMSHDAIGPNAIQSFANQIKGGKAYAKQWADHRKALEEWKTGKKPAEEKPAEPTKKAEGEKAAEADPVTGTWEATLTVREQLELQLALTLVRSGTKVTGSVTMGFAGRQGRPRDIETGKYEGGKLTLVFGAMGRGGENKATLEATLKGDTMTGKVSLGRMGEEEFTAKRTSKEAKTATAQVSKPAAKPKDEGKPKPPKTNETLEPLRAAIEGRAALVVTTRRGPAVKDVITLLEQEKIPYVLRGVDDLLHDAEIAGDHRPTVLVGPVVMREEDDGTRLCVPALFADRGQPIVFASGECAGTRHLPLHAAYAVRYGLSPSDALAALTLWPAKAFHLDDHIGSLEKGKDADFVVFSGNPFEPQSRVLLVVCNGVIAVDNHSETDNHSGTGSNQ